LSQEPAEECGGRIITLISSTKDIQVLALSSRRGMPLVGKDVGEALGIGKLDVKVDD